MRLLLIAVLVLLGNSCERNEAKGHSGAGTGVATVRSDDTEREQARFDSERRPEKVVEALGLKPGSRVADVGAGSGLLTVHLARAVKPGGRVVATDIDEGVLELMQSRLAAAGLADVVERKVVAADVPGLGQGHDFDAILLAEVDHYFSDPVLWLKTAALALKPGGRLVISNRVHHRQKSMAGAAKAGLKLDSVSTPVPTHFVAVFIVDGRGSGK